MLKRYTDAELEGFLDDLESDRVERKETFKGDVPQKARQGEGRATGLLGCAWDGFRMAAGGKDG